MSSACRVARRRASAFRIAARRASIHVSRLRSACACLVVSLSLVSLGGVALADRLQTSPVPDLRDGTPTLWALTRARLVVRPGLVLENATIVIHEGKIAGAGTGIAVPAGARVLDLDGKTVYPGFIDAYGSVDVAAPAEGVAYWNPEIRPRADAGSAWGAIAGPHEALRSQGVVARLVAPRDGIVRGTSVIVSTGNGPAGLSLLRPAAALHIGLIPSIGGAPENYPRSPMGAAALLRQAFYDADWLDRAQGAHRADPRLPAPERNDDLEALVSWRGSDRIVVASVPNERWIFRADSIARELSLRLVIHGTGREYRRIDAIRALRRPIIVPLDFPRPPDVGTPESALDVSLEELLHWDFAPENPARLVAAGIPIAFTSEGLEDRRQFLARVRRAVRRGLDPNEALRALTTLPAELLGISSELGTVEPGKLASIIVTDGDIFDDDTKIVDVWVRGTRYELETPEWFDVTGTWTIDSKLGAPIESLTLDARGRGLRGELRLRTTAPAAATNGANESSEAKGANDANDASNANDGAASDNEGAEPSGEGGAEKANGGKEPAPPESIALARAAVRDGRLALVFPTERLGGTGFARLSAVISHGGDGALAATGRVIWPDGRVEPFAARRSGDVPQGASGEDAKDETEGDATKEGATESTEPPLPSDDTPPGDEEAIVDESAGENATRGARGGRRRDRRPADEPASFAVNYPLGAFGRTSPPRPERVLFQNATVWTCGPQGVIEDGDVLIENGWIIAIGKDLVVDATTRTVSLRGKHLTPGLIDCHSHMATDGGINEGTQSITAEVRIGDFLDCDDIDIYRQLAGGLTTANVLHGSANPIGGQNQVIKLRWGLISDELKFREAPAGIKFALGENVKRSNRRTPSSRYPQSRMGVEQLFRDAFAAARAYDRDRRQWDRDPNGLPLRRDLELETLAEILRGERWIHCHSYRQDEILAFLRVLDDFDVTVGSLQHILEGYKVADVLAQHGATASSFSDWWAYKFEVYDAIPYNGALMHRAGIVVSFNSDDRELARHMNHEAAKAVKYGGVPEEEALKFVTLNPAKQLRIDAWVGSIELGKHADIAIWSGHPLSCTSRCEEVWIDGRRYFSLEEDLEKREEAQRMRAELVQKVLRSGEAMLPRSERRPDPVARFKSGDGDGCLHGVEDME